MEKLGTGKKTGLSIHIFAMANSHDLNGDNVLLDFVDDPVVIHAKAIGVLAPMQFFSPAGKGFEDKDVTAASTRGIHWRSRLRSSLAAEAFHSMRQIAITHYLRDHGFM